MARNFTWIEGTVAAFNVYQSDLSATSVVIYLQNEDTNEVISSSASYVDGVANVEFDGADTATPGTYKYQVNEVLSGGGLAKYGAVDCDQDGGCDWGYVIICPALDGGIS